MKTITFKQREQIAQAVIKVLYTRFNSFPEEDGVNRNAPFHVAFLKAFQTKLDGRVKDVPDFINLSSWMHGLNTSLGQSFFETVAHILCDGEKRDFKSKKIYKNQMSAIADIMIDLKNGTQQPSLQREDDIINQNAYGEMQDAPNFTADCFYETDKDVVAIELKSVRPNSGEMRGEKQKILIGKAVLRALYPGKNVKYIFGFPFDPTSDGDTTFDKPRFLHYLVEAEKFVAHEDFMIADELWSFLALGDDAMKGILEIINQIATPEFMDIFDKIQNSQTDKAEKYELLKQWHQYTEAAFLNEFTNEFLDEIDELCNECRFSNREWRIFNQAIFKPDGSYNDKRAYELQKILDLR